MRFPRNIDTRPEKVDANKNMQKKRPNLANLENLL